MWIRKSILALEKEGAIKVKRKCNALFTKLEEDPTTGFAYTQEELADSML